MRLADERYEEIKEEVIDLFVRYDVRCIPISGFELAYKMGIRLVAYSTLSSKKLETALRVSTDGFYFEPGNEREYIFFNDSIAYERANMTILHEIGHGVLGHHEGMDPDEAETEAKFFAKYAAAPPPLIHQLKPEYPEEIADSFAISYEAAIYAFDYYQKWVRKHRQTGIYYAYEKRLLQLFIQTA